MNVDTTGMAVHVHCETLVDSAAASHCGSWVYLCLCVRKQQGCFNATRDVYNDVLVHIDKADRLTVHVVGRNTQRVYAAAFPPLQGADGGTDGSGCVVVARQHTFRDGCDFRVDTLPLPGTGAVRSKGESAWADLPRDIATHSGLPSTTAIHAMAIPSNDTCVLAFTADDRTRSSVHDVVQLWRWVASDAAQAHAWRMVDAHISPAYSLWGTTGITFPPCMAIAPGDRTRVAVLSPRAKCLWLWDVKPQYTGDDKPRGQAQRRSLHDLDLSRSGDCTLPWFMTWCSPDAIVVLRRQQVPLEQLCLKHVIPMQQVAVGRNTPATLTLLEEGCLAQLASVSGLFATRPATEPEELRWGRMTLRATAWSAVALLAALAGMPQPPAEDIVAPLPALPRAHQGRAEFRAAEAAGRALDIVPDASSFVLRMDGVQFSKFTRRHFSWPNDVQFARCMRATTLALLPVLGAAAAMWHNDEISLLVLGGTARHALQQMAAHDSEAAREAALAKALRYQHTRRGRVSTLLRDAVALTTMAFQAAWSQSRTGCGALRNMALQRLPRFDARLLVLTDFDAAARYMQWRRSECAYRATFSLFRQHFGHKAKMHVERARDKLGYVWRQQPAWFREGECWCTMQRGKPQQQAAVPVNGVELAAMLVRGMAGVHQEGARGGGGDAGHLEETEEAKE